MHQYPLIYTFREVLSGRGFVAGVAVQGKALLVHEEDEWVVYGVQPGGLSDTGATPQEAHAAFRQAFKEILFDLAEEARDIAHLQTLVQTFVAQINEEQSLEWNEARAAVRAGAHPEEPFAAKLPQERGEVKCGVSVQRLDDHKTTPTPADNKLDEFKTAA